MNKYLYTLLAITCLGGSLFAQTSLTIIGTAHEQTNKFNADTLLNVLKTIKPDVILMELDTTLMDGQGNFKRIDNENEGVATRAYQKVNSSLIVRRFDIEGRSVYYASHNTLAMESKMSKAIDSLWKHNALDRFSTQTMSAYYSANQALNILYDMGIRVLNSKAYMDLASFRQYWLYKKELAVLKSTPQLSQYIDFFKDDGNFWDTRNKAMINNIANYIKTFKGKKIVVLTGAMHKYYLTNGLSPMQNQLHFKLETLPNTD